MRAQFGQRRVGALGDQRLQTIPAAGRQQRLATTPVRLGFQRPARFEVLAHPPHGRHAVTETGGNVRRAFAPIVKVKNPLTHRNRNGFHAATLPRQMPNCKLHVLWKCSKSQSAANLRSSFIKPFLGRVFDIFLRGL